MHKMEEAQVLRNKGYRGQIMRTLGLFYPAPVTVSNLKSALMAKGQSNVAETENHLHYLKGKGYIEVSNGITTENRADDFVTLTSKGVDLIEATISDPGVML